jgi:hypothetical protein
MEPKHKKNCMRVLACVLRVFQQESVDGLNAEALLEEIGYDGSEEEILGAMFELRDHVEGLDLKTPIDEDEEEPESSSKDKTPKTADGPTDDEKRNAWFARVARYLAYCLDGGILGNRLTLGDVVDYMQRIPSESGKRVQRVVDFCLHLRSRDFKKVYFEMPIYQQMRDPSFNTFIFDDRVMQLLLESGYLVKLFPKAPGEQMSSAYAQFLATVLSGQQASISLKAGICRQVLRMAAQGENSASAGLPEDFIAKLIQALVQTMNSDTAFLATYAVASMVNLSADNDNVKNLLMAAGAGSTCVKQLKSKDDELMTYTLLLLTNLTKSVHHRAIVVSYGLVNVLMDILTSSYRTALKHKMLGILASVIGQMCNDEDSRAQMAKKQTVPCYLYIYDQAHMEGMRWGGPQLQTKVMFMLKQIVANDPGKKQEVGEHIIKILVIDMINNRDNMEFLSSAQMLLAALALDKINCQTMVKPDIDMNACLDELVVGNPDKGIKGIQDEPEKRDLADKLKELRMRIKMATHTEQFALR